MYKIGDLVGLRIPQTKHKTGIIVCININNKQPPVYGIIIDGNYKKIKLYIEGYIEKIR